MAKRTLLLIGKAETAHKLDLLANKLRRRQLVGSHAVALETLKLIREVLSVAKFASFDSLVAGLHQLASVLQHASPKEPVITNTVLRVMNLVTDEYTTALASYLASSSSTSVPSTPFSAPMTPAAGAAGRFFSSGGLYAGMEGTAITGGGSSPGTTVAGEAPSPVRPPLHHQSGSVFDLLGSSVNVNSSSGGDYQSGSSTPRFTATPTVGSTSGGSVPQTPRHRSGADEWSTSSETSYSRAITRQPTLPAIAQAPAGALLASEFSAKAYTLKPLFNDAIKEFSEEIEGVHRAVGEQALEHVHAGECVLTIGRSRTVEAFLKAAFRKRKFTVICAETAPSCEGRDQAACLSAAGIPTILIPDSNIFALLARCSKVLLGPHAVLADGSLVSHSGSLPLCLAAKRLRVPVVVASGMFKFSPGFKGPEGVEDWESPAAAWEGAEQEGDDGEGVEVRNPRFEIVPSRLVDLYVTNLGAHPSSLLYRLLSDMYS